MKTTATMTAATRITSKPPEPAEVKSTSKRGLYGESFHITRLLNLKKVVIYSERELINSECPLKREV